MSKKAIYWLTFGLSSFVASASAASLQDMANTYAKARSVKDVPGEFSGHAFRCEHTAGGAPAGHHVRDGVGIPAKHTAEFIRDGHGLWWPFLLTGDGSTVFRYLRSGSDFEAYHPRYPSLFIRQIDQTSFIAKSMIDQGYSLCRLDDSVHR